MTDSNNLPNGANESNEHDVTDRLIDLIMNIPLHKQRQLLDWLNEWDLRGKRKHKRKTCLIAVDYSTPDRFYREFIHDISAGGLYIETSKLLERGQELSLTFSVPNSDLPMRLIGEIVRTDNSGIAVELKNVSKYQEEILSSLLKKM